MLKKLSFCVAGFAILITMVVSPVLARPNHGKPDPAPDPDTPNSIQNDLIGLTPEIEAQANYGVGIKFGVIDTGVAAQWIGFSPEINGTGINNIDGASACMISGCLNSFDDNGHGTFVTSEIVGGVPSAGMSGIARGGTAIAVKVLNADGIGYADDVAEGIIHAVDNGKAQVLNLSLGPSGTPAQQAAFYESIAGAVNHAAEKGVVIVFAGGNAGEAFAGGANIHGFTDQAIKQIIITGSTNARKKLSSWSNTPGSGGFILENGDTYSYKNMWLTADGENIWGASNYSPNGVNYNYVVQMSGTSMTAPQAAGAAGLLMKRWDHLASQGTISEILARTAQDLGKPGVDTTYGSGFLDLIQAFTAIGPMTVPVNGKKIRVSDTRVVAGGAFGGMTQLSNAFEYAVGYDDYMRDFPITLSTTISAKSPTKSTQSAVTRVLGPTGANAQKFVDLGDGAWMLSNGDGNDLGDLQSVSKGMETEDWSFGFSQNGRYIGAGHGNAAGLTFNDARWGGHTAFFNNDISGTTDLLNLVPNRDFSAMGLDFGDNSRFSLTVVKSADDTSAYTASNTSAQAGAFSYTMRPDTDWTISVTSSILSEQNMLLGSTSTGVFALPPTSATYSVGLGANINLGEGYQLGIDAATMSTAASENPNSLITHTSNLTSASFALALAKQDFLGTGGAMNVWLKAPMRVYAGSADVSVPVDTDINGAAVFHQDRVSLVPSATEVDVGMDYNLPLPTNGMTAGFSFVYRQDAGNVEDTTDMATMLRIGAKY